MKDDLTLVQKHTQPRVLALIIRDPEVVVEVAAVGGEPGNSPVLPRLVGFKLRQWGTGDEHQRGLACLQMGQTAGEVVRQVRAAWAAVLPARIKHEMVDNQLTAPVEEVEQTHLTGWTLEVVLLVDLDHRQSAPFRIEPVSRVGGFLFLEEQLLARNEPLL